MPTFLSSSLFPRRAATLTAVVGILLPACSHTPTEATGSDPGFFTRRVRPIFESNCLQCHDGRSPSGDLDLRNRDAAFRDSPNGPFFVPGRPEDSKVFRVVKLAEDVPGAMPPSGHSLSRSEIETLRKWIATGAYWPSGAAGELASEAPPPRSH